MCEGPESNETESEFYLDTSCEEALNWTPRNGFIYDGTVFLFDSIKVTMFPESYISVIQTYNASGNSTLREVHKVTMKMFKQFINCDIDVPLKNLTPHTRGK